MSNAHDVFSALSKRGQQVLKLAKKNALTPDLAKKPRLWGINDVCKIVGKTRKTLHDLEEKGVISPIKIKSKTPSNRTRRKYTLAHINKIREHYNIRLHRPSGTQAIIIAVMNNKGGSTKTESTNFICQGLAIKGYRVLKIDTDSQGSATYMDGYIPDTDIDGDTDTLLPLFRANSVSIKKIIRKTHWDGLDLIPANLSLYKSEFELPVRQIQDSEFQFYSVLKEKLDDVKNDYDVIVLDSPPSMGMLSANVFYAADGYIIPTPPSIIDFASTVQFFNMATELSEHLPEKQLLFLRLVISKHKRGSKVSPSTDDKMVECIREAFGNFVAEGSIPLSEAITKSKADLLTILEVEKYKGSYKTYDNVKNAIDNLTEDVETLLIRSWKQILEEREAKNTDKEASNHV